MFHNKFDKLFKCNVCKKEQLESMLGKCIGSNVLLCIPEHLSCYNLNFVNDYTPNTAKCKICQLKYFL